MAKYGDDIDPEKIVSMYRPHRRGHLIVNSDLTVTCDTHSTWKFNA